MIRIALKTYLLVISLFFYLDAFSQNQNVADSLISIYRSLNYKSLEELELLNDIAFFETAPQKKIYYANILIELAKQKSLNIWTARGYIQNGNAYRLLGNYEKAINAYFFAAKFSKKEDYKLGLGGAYISIGDVYSVSNNHDNSILYYNKALRIFRLLNDSTKLSTALLNAGDEYFNYNELDSALSYFLEAKSIFSKINYEIGVAYALGNIGLVYAKLDMNDLAEGHINQATEVLENLGDKYPIAVYQTYMADIYKEKGDSKTALEYAHKSLQIGEEEGLKEQIRDASLKLSELYEDVRAFEKAYEYQSQYLSYRDSINNEETINKIADLRTEYEVSKKQVEVDLLNKTSENQRILLINLLLVALLIAALAYLFYHRSKVRLKLVKIESARKREMEAQRDQLELLNETKDKFFSIISHDLRSPAANFKGVSYILKGLVDNFDKEKFIRICDQLDKSATELTTLLDNLLQWALSQQGRFPYKPEKVEMYQLISSTFNILGNIADSKGIALNHTIEGKIELFVDKNSAETIIRNLISNALKFTPQGGEISLSASVNINMVEIKITDTGVGMSAEVLSSLFDFKAKKSQWGTDGEKGIGLGLILVNDFAKLNGGSVSAESEVGVGTTFSVFLPLYAS